MEKIEKSQSRFLPNKSIRGRVRTASQDDGVAFVETKTQTMRLHRTSSFSKAPRRNLLAQIMEAYVQVHVKDEKKTKSIFSMRKRKLWACASIFLPRIVMYSNESKQNEIYVVSLSGASVEFKPDASQTVAANCFCLKARLWKTGSTIQFRPQTFYLYVDDQQQVWRWVYCITCAIKHAREGASHTDDDIFSTMTEVKQVSSDDEDSGDNEEAENFLIETKCMSDESMPPSQRHNKVPTLEKYPSDSDLTKSKHPSTKNIFILGAKGLSKPILKLRKHRFLTKSDEQMSKSLLNRAMNGFHVKSPATNLKIESSLNASMASPQLKFPTTSEPASPAKMNQEGSLKPLRSHESLMTPLSMQVQQDTISAKFVACLQGSMYCYQIFSQLLNSLPWMHEVIFMSLNYVAGTTKQSVAWVIACGGMYSYRLQDVKSSFEMSCICFLMAYLLGYGGGVMASPALMLVTFAWGHAEFLQQQRLRFRREMQKIEREETHDFSHVHLPVWVKHNSADRVEWVNNIIKRGWPHLSQAIAETIELCLNPILEANKPPYVSSIEFSHIHFGDTPPKIGGVESLNFDHDTNELGIDVETRFVANSDQLAELRLTSTVGVAANIRLRELTIIGTVRLIFKDLCNVWPCFRTISVSFINKPKLEFSLTAAKLNITNVPFASEWLRTFLRDTLIEYIIWPRTFEIPVWLENEGVEPAVDTLNAMMVTLNEKELQEIKLGDEMKGLLPPDQSPKKQNPNFCGAQKDEATPMAIRSPETC